MAGGEVLYLKVEGGIIGPLSQEEALEGWLQRDFLDSHQAFSAKKKCWVSLKDLFPAQEVELPVKDFVNLPLSWREHRKEILRKSLPLPQVPKPTSTEIPDWAQSEKPPLPSLATRTAKELLQKIQVPNFEELNDWLQSVREKSVLKTQAPKSPEKPLAVEEPLSVPKGYSGNWGAKLVFTLALLSLTALLAFFYYADSFKRRDTSFTPTPAPSLPNQKQMDSPPLRSPTKPQRDY